MNIQKDSAGIWRLNGNGRQITTFESDWAPGEPASAPGANCASIQKTLG